MSTEKEIQPVKMLEDEFALAAMQAILSSDRHSSRARGLSDVKGIDFDEAVAELAYEQASKMMKVRKKKRLP